MRIARRTLIGALTSLAAAPALARRKKRKPETPADQPPGQPYEALTAALLVHFPESAAYSGAPGALDGGALARTFDDWSPAGEAAARAALQAARDDLARLPSPQGEVATLQREAIAATLENGLRSVAIPWGRTNPFNFTGHMPYAVSQISGPHIDSLAILATQQSLSSANAVDAWLEKLDSMPEMLAAAGEKVRADAAAGCVPPRILAEKALPVFDALLAGRARNQPLLKALEDRMTAAGLSQRIKANALRRANTSFARKARPAMARLRAQMAAMLPNCRAEAGIWAQPQGEALYAANVTSLGDTALSPDEIHRLGLDEVGRIAADMDRLLAGQGMSGGPIGERMAALSRDPANQFEDSDAGREALLAFVRAKVADAEARYGEILPPAMIPKQALEVRRVPVATQDGAPGGFYDGPSLDGTRPGIFWINLRDMSAVPRFRLQTLAYHEGVPGHHTQGAVSALLGEAPLLLKMASFNAYQEGWALYAEWLMAELDIYRDNPLGNLGRLQDELFRAARLVVDTGIHHKRWTREAAIRTMRDLTGVAESRVTAEVERYMAWPAQALGYKLGQLRLLELRKRYMSRKNADVRAFHAAVLGGGAMPLALIERRLAQGKAS